MSRWIKTLFLSLSAVLLCGGLSSVSSAIDPPNRSNWYSPGHRHPDRVALVITRVAYGSPAFRAGLERGDVIVAVDGRDLDTPSELHRALHRTGYRGALTVRNIRSGRLVRVAVFPVDGHIGINVQQTRF